MVAFVMHGFRERQGVHVLCKRSGFWAFFGSGYCEDQLGHMAPKRCDMAIAPLGVPMDKGLNTSHVEEIWPRRKRLELNIYKKPDIESELVLPALNAAHT